MAITYTFKVNKIEVAPALGELTNVVTRVRYDYKGVDENGVDGIFPGVTPMPSPSDAAFKPLTELVEEDVISWLEAHADKGHMQEVIGKQISSKIAPKYVDTPLPWVEISEPIEELVEPQEEV
jgi:hypothetical protein